MSNASGHSSGRTTASRSSRAPSDLRNPLNVARGRIELAREDGDSGQLDVATNAIDRSLRLIDDLLTLAREGDRATDVEPVALAALADRSWQHVETADATLVTDTEATVRADRDRLRRLLENLFRNAVEHGRTDVTVTIGDLEGGFYVADEGPGIPEDDRERVFEAGYSTAADGTGFGLSIVSDIADAHGWDVDVTDSRTGGARFEITGAAVTE